MYYWKITQSLNNPNASEWEELSKLVLGADVHPDRKLSFFLSREALKNAFHDFGLEVAIKDLMLINHDKVVNFPQLTISLTHTKDGGAALVGERKFFRSVGIDMEHETRVVKENILERIAHPQDITLRKIEVWCLKEAVFKALMNTGIFPKPIEFGSIQLLKETWLHQESGLKGTWEIKLVSPYLVALAFVKN